MKTTTKIAPVNHAPKYEPVIELANDPEEALTVSRLVTYCGVGREDDTPEESATRLAAMALILSNIAAAHLVAVVDGEEADLGVGFAIEGGFLAADIEESVIAYAYRYQERWERTLMHTVDSDMPGHSRYNKLIKKNTPDFCDALLLPGPRLRRKYATKQMQVMQATVDKAEAAKGKGDALATKPKGTGANITPQQPAVQPQAASPGQSADTQEGQNAMCSAELDLLLSALSPNGLDIVNSIVPRRDTTNLREALGYRVFLADATTTTGLEKRVMQAHLGRFMIHSSIASYDALERTGKTLEEFKHHRNIVRGDATLTLRADPVLCVGSGVLNEAIMRGTHRNPGLNRLLWLVESAPGCDLPDTRKTGLKYTNALQNFSLALDLAMRRRIDFSATYTQALPALDGELTSWRKFLREHERNSPGITSAVGNLPFALFYGLGSMVSNSATLYGNDVVVFAKWLVMRMVNRLATATSQGQRSGIERLAARLANKLLSEGPMTVRDLTRKVSKLKSGECRQALEWLASRQIAAQKGNQWGILGDATTVMALVAANAS
jgi:hypothetical protein